MFGEPLLAHPAERGGIHASRHPHPRDRHDRDQYDDDTDGEQHMVLRIHYASPLVGAAVQSGTVGGECLTYALLVRPTTEKKREDTI